MSADGDGARHRHVDAVVPLGDLHERCGEGRRLGGAVVGAPPHHGAAVLRASASRRPRSVAATVVTWVRSVAGSVASTAAAAVNPMLPGRAVTSGTAGQPASADARSATPAASTRAYPAAVRTWATAVRGTTRTASVPGGRRATVKLATPATEPIRRVRPRLVDEGDRDAELPRERLLHLPGERRVRAGHGDGADGEGRRHGEQHGRRHGDDEEAGGRGRDDAAAPHGAGEAAHLGRLGPAPLGDGTADAAAVRAQHGAPDRRRLRHRWRRRRRHVGRPPHRCSGAAASRDPRAERICGTMRYTDPQPRVITKSPGRASSATRSAAACQSGT